MAGKDASKQFWKYHNESILKKYKGQLQLGSLDSKKQAAPPTPPATPSPASQKQQEVAKPQAEPGAVVPVPGMNSREAAESMDPYGDLVPYADPSWYQSVRRLHTSGYCICGADSNCSITHPTSMKLMPHSAKKSAHGSTPRLRQTLLNGTKPRKSLIASTSKWESVAT